MVAATAFIGAGCGDDDHRAPTITVFAAASLSDAFTHLGAAFGAANPETAVTFNFAASSELAAQIGEGAPADVFASADVANMTKAVDAGAVDAPRTFATNTLAIIVEPGNPLGITGVDDLADPDLVVVIGAPEVPVGRYAQRVFDQAGVTVTAKSLEENVRAVVSKVVLGEADAGIVYATDVLVAGDTATGVAIPDDINVVAEYPIAVVHGASHEAVARAFVDFVLSPAGQTILRAHGFGAP